MTFAAHGEDVSENGVLQEVGFVWMKNIKDLERSI
jgi:hypothetical protein